MIIGIVGQDQRQRAVAAAFEKRGHRTIPFSQISDGADITVLPMPVSEDGVHIYGTNILLIDLFELFRGRRLYGGRVSASVQRLATEMGVELVDHFACESEVVLNVIPTVEGALQIAMEQTDHTLHGSKILVCGFGRIGKLLTHVLTALGADVTVSMRKQTDFAWARAYGYHAIHTDMLLEHVGDKDIIFNTVPFLIFGARELDRTRALIIDLASAPGGVDFAYASSVGKTVLQALGLPAKVAPRTAGEIICDTILEEENTGE